MLLNNEIVYRRLDDEEIILHLKTGTYFGLNQTGTFLFDCCKQNPKISEHELATALSAEFEIDMETAMKDVSAFLNDLRENNLIAVSAGAKK